MPQPWVTLLISVIFGGVAGATLTILYNRVAAKQAARGREGGAIASLAGELWRCRLLCDHNAKLRQNATAPFIRFPTTVSENVTFGERHAFPRMEHLQSRLEAFALAAIHVNQLIDLHHQLWSSTETPSSVSKGAPGRREELRFQIADICSGQIKLESVGPEGFVVLPTFVDAISKEVDDIAKRSAKLTT